MAADTLKGNKLFTSDGEHIGKISEITLDVRGGRIAYAVLASGGFLGMGEKPYAIPWSALTVGTDEKCFRLDVTADRVKNAPCSDKDHWAAMGDAQWCSSLDEYYNQQPYWLAAGRCRESPVRTLKRTPAGWTVSEPNRGRSQHHPRISYALEVDHEQGSNQGYYREGEGQDQ
ncbi:PRC-barrel domain-containing protein [Caballeronia choica]|jgi:hypothetical protein|uniref:PRC-barrel domain-containing protein n=1 Tax=Caballeronia choica TaxID=326476 RepID=A0A158KSY8_9BURK|nr:PRC-barrel domain-containing protein [Caballeronia choica]